MDTNLKQCYIEVLIAFCKRVEVDYPNGYYICGIIYNRFGINSKIYEHFRYTIIKRYGTIAPFTKFEIRERRLLLNEIIKSLS